MKVIKATPIAGEVVKFENEWYDYIRYSHDCWYKCYGGEDTEVHDEECISQLEAAYQEYSK